MKEAKLLPDDENSNTVLLTKESMTLMTIMDAMGPHISSLGLRRCGLKYSIHTEIHTLHTYPT